jgi:hypothetical protein
MVKNYFLEIIANFLARCCFCYNGRNCGRNASGA